MSPLFHTCKNAACRLYHTYKGHHWVQLFHQYKHRDIVYIIFFAFLSLKVRLDYFFYAKRKGFPYSEDSQWYIDYAHSLMSNFKIGLHMNDIMYVGYNLLLTLLLAIFKDPLAILFIQAVAAGLSVILVYRIASMLFNRVTAIIASYFYAYQSWGITLWTTYILSDSFFINILLLNVYYLLRFMETKRSLHKYGFAVTAILMLLFRPSGIITLFFIVLYIIVNLHRKQVFPFVRKHRLAIGGLAAVAAAACVYVLTSVNLDPLVSSMQFNMKKVLYNIYANGWIYDKPSQHDHFFRPNYNINILNSLTVSFIINNWDHIMIIYAKRTIAFLGRWVWQTDIHSASGIIQLVNNLLPTLLFLTGTVAAIVNGLFRKASVIWLIIFSVFIFCIFFFIDGLYRYKAPAIPFIAIAAAYGADRIIQGILTIAKKYTGKLSRYGTRKTTNCDSGV